MVIWKIELCSRDGQHADNGIEIDNIHVEQKDSRSPALELVTGSSRLGFLTVT